MRRGMSEDRKRAKKAAQREYDYAFEFPDWSERRNVFAAMDLLDQMEGPGIEDAFYAVQNRLKALNAALPRSAGDTTGGGA